MPCRIAFLLAILLLPFALPAWAADQASPAKRGPQAEEFYRVQGEMNRLLAQLAELQVKYRTASEEKRDDIQAQWKTLIAKGDQLELTLIAAAEKAYAEAPNADAQIVDYLVKVMHSRVQQDNYEPAAEIGKLLMEHKCPNKHVPNLAGISAFAVSDFDNAEKYLKVAEAQGRYTSVFKDEKDRLGQAGAVELQKVDYCRQAWAKEKVIRADEAKTDNLPRVLLKTSKGDIELELFENEAPNTVANFIPLVEKGLYKDTPFHRVLQGFMAQGGDPQGNGSGGPGYSIPCECYKANYRTHYRGTLSMAHAGRDTGGSQFFLTFVPTFHLDGKHTVFGRVVNGMDVLSKLQRRNPEDPEASRPDKILDAKVLRKRAHEYKPQKMPQQ